MSKLKRGRARVTPDMTAHTPGINQGNAKGNYEKNAGFNPVFADHRLHRTTTQSQNGNFGLVHDRREVSAANAALV